MIPQILIAAWLIIALIGSLWGTWCARIFPMVEVEIRGHRLPIMPWCMAAMVPVGVVLEAGLLWAGGFWG